ncbi:MAG TPA: class I SAM-dependent methyltransferase [Blastocatellia bacterium]|nr:class I SAM-dependent methyltransferase [Blastocatellia bacterium]
MSKSHEAIFFDRRFEFGENWKRFLRVLTAERIAMAENSLKQMLEINSLEGKSFLDVGSGSGLFSLAAYRLGARVHSFDYDPKSVACTKELKRRFASSDSDWVIEQASVLDDAYIRSLGHFDVIYSWGVLHHTGDMWRAFENVSICAAPDSRLFIAIYNDQGSWSVRWRRIKRTYNRLPRFLRLPFAVLVMGPRELRPILLSMSRLQFSDYLRSWSSYQTNRGMSRWHDLVDWIGGYPFEVARPEQIFDFYRPQGYVLDRLKTCGGGLGCNEFVFTRTRNLRA